MKRTLLAIFRTGQRCRYYPLADDQNGSPTENQQTEVQVHSREVCRDNGLDKIRTLFVERGRQKRSVSRTVSPFMDRDPPLSCDSATFSRGS
jgi:hypothetical protein